MKKQNLKSEAIKAWLKTSQKALKRGLPPPLQFKSITNKEYNSLKTHIPLTYEFHTTPFGKCLIASSNNTICYLGFYDNEEQGITSLKKTWSHSNFIKDKLKTESLIKTIFYKSKNFKPQKVSLLLKGTSFQILVWGKLLSIPQNFIFSYRDIATLCNKPSASRAVAQAIAHNHIAYLIPCHRIISSSGAINGYRWGVDRKLKLLSSEHNSFFM